MSFTASLSTTGNTAVITLAGSLDDNPAAEEFREKVATAATQGINRLVLEMSQLENLSAAGCRGVLVVAGDILDTTRFPVIDVAHGGSIDGEIAALNRLVDLAIT